MVGMRVRPTAGRMVLPCGVGGAAGRRLSAMFWGMLREACNTQHLLTREGIMKACRNNTSCCLSEVPLPIPAAPMHAGWCTHRANNRTKRLSPLEPGPCRDDAVLQDGRTNALLSQAGCSCFRQLQALSLA